MCVDRFWLIVFFFSQKTAYGLRIVDWISDVCSSDLDGRHGSIQSARGGGGAIVFFAPVAILSPILPGKRIKACHGRPRINVVREANFMATKPNHKIAAAVVREDGEQIGRAHV